MSERKEKIKSIAIVFLSIMLVLTFFSNTIMNYSLVEVSTQGVYGGSITTKVRGSGTVEAAESVTVEAASGRKIETISVKTGAEVEEGDVLFTLGAGDSDELAAAKDAYESAKNSYEIAILQAGITVAERQVIESGNFGSLSDRQNAVVSSGASAEELQKEYDDLTAYINEKKTAQTKAEDAIDAANDKLAAAQAIITLAENGTDDGENEPAADVVEQARKDKADAETTISDKEKEISDIKYYLGEVGARYQELKKQLADTEANEGLANDYIQQITLGQQYEELCELKEKVEELQGTGGDKEIKAPMAGTVTQINYYAGQTIKENTIVMEIKPENEAYTMQFTVSQTQSKRIKPGDPAEILYNWYADEITARVATVQRDPMNRESYIVTCELFGDVGVGDYYTVSIGQQSSDYDYVVPTSCIREDSNGKFVLTIEAKSTPLGNRYYARRTDVEVITSDDSQSAVTGAFDGYVYVITTTSKPVEENQQVRLAE
ncbi:MAG: HlyD family efflux transporter periplasmic adaptor subunit [Roseburia sp.]|nr:HlyD family efflux transporter periplasmic adaptor subunit [Roseburia sp.]